MRIGQLIRMEREKQNVKQNELARSICSPSYLSKIEKGTVTPGDEIQEQLLRRLNIQLDQLNDTLRTEQFTQFNERFKVALNNRDKSVASLLCKDICLFLGKNPFYQQRVDLLIMETRLMLMFKERFNEAQKNIILFRNIKKDMTHAQLFHLHLIKGIVAYMEKRFREASQLLRLAFNITTKQLMEDWEIAELHYVSSVAALAEYRYISAMDHADKANIYFNKEMLVDRSIECLFILSIAQKRFNRLEEALSSFQKMKSLLTPMNASKFQGKIEHNIGACHSLLQNTEQAIFHFTKSLDLKTNPNHKAVTILAIIKEYNKIGDQKNAQEWIARAFELLIQLSKENHDFYANHFAFYKAILIESPNFLSTINEVLRYLEEKKDYMHCSIYSNVLANRLSENGQYKLATTYYRKSFDYNLKQKNLTSWEELS